MFLTYGSLISIPYFVNPIKLRKMSIHKGKIFSMIYIKNGSILFPFLCPSLLISLFILFYAFIFRKLDCPCNTSKSQCAPKNRSIDWYNYILQNTFFNACPKQEKW